MKMLSNFILPGFAVGIAVAFWVHAAYEEGRRSVINMFPADAEAILAIYPGTNVKLYRTSEDHDRATVIVNNTDLPLPVFDKKIYRRIVDDDGVTETEPGGFFVMGAPLGGRRAR